MGVMTEFVAFFPHSIVRFVPMFANVLAALAQHLLHLVIGLFIYEKMRDRLDHFAINVELRLFTRRVADPYGARTKMTGQLRQLAFARRTFAENIVTHA